MSAPGLSKAEGVAVFENIGRFMAVGFMISIRVNLTDHRDWSLRAMLTIPEVAAMWTRALNKRSADTFETLLSACGLSEAVRIAALSVNAMEAEAQRILRLDEQGRFDPVNPDPRSRRLLRAMQAADDLEVGDAPVSERAQGLHVLANVVR